MEKIVYLTLDNYDATATLKQHIFKSRIQETPYTYEKYNGNISLCGKITAVEDTELSSNIDDLNDETISNNLCKICKNILDKRPDLGYPVNNKKERE